MNFYEFRDKNYKYFRVTNLQDISSDRILCDDFSYLNPLEFRYYVGGSVPHDIVATGWVSLYLISKKTIDILKSNNITGWRDYPAVVYDKKNNILNDYSILSITGKCSSINWTKSFEFQKQYTLFSVVYILSYVVRHSVFRYVVAKSGPLAGIFKK